jgi:hypothetical protein
MKADNGSNPGYILITTIIILICSGGCNYYRIHRTVQPEIYESGTIPSEGKYVILHCNENVYHLTGFSLVGDTLKGIITPLEGHELYKKADPNHPNRYRQNSKRDESGVLNEVHIYTYVMVETDSQRVSVPLKSINKIDVNEKDTGATVASWTFSIIGAVTATAAIVTVIVFLTKESCPFVYPYNGTDYTLAGEIFSGAVRPGLERDDYLFLPSIKECDGSYQLKITNEVKEVQFVNYAGLVIFDSNPGCSVLIDKNGNPYSFCKPVSPLYARSICNSDILPLVIKKDSLSYLGNETDKTNHEEIIMKFIRPHDAKSARLIIRAKNSFWLDGLIFRVNKLFGERYETYSAKQDKAPGEKLRKWQADQHMPLSVFIEKDGKWQFADYFNLAGPMALKDDILPLDLDGIESDTVTIRLSTGFLFWELDYAAMDFGAGDNVSVTELSLEKAIDNAGADVKELMRTKDNSYYVLENTGDGAILSFNAPVHNTGKRSVFLHTRGYYKILMNQTGPPDKKTLRAFRKPDRLPLFSKEVFDSLSHK